jgi:hypothetical protein
LVLGHLRLGDVEEAERRLGSMPQETRDAAGIYTPDLVVRAEVALARGEVDTGLGLWRRAVARVRGAAAPGTDPYLGPWLVELQAAAVTTHVRHGRPEAVARDAAELPGKLLGLLQAPDSGLPATLMAMPVCGAVLLALATVDLHEGRDPESGARLTALAERFRYQPTVSAVRAGPNASQTVGPAYTAAVAEYAGLDRAGLRAAAVALVTARERGRTAS